MHSSESHQFRYARARCSAPKPMLAGLQLSGGGHCRTFLPTDFNRMGSTACASRQQLQTVDPFQTEDHGIRSLPQVYLSTGGFHFSSLLYMARCAFAGSTQFRAICKQEKSKTWRGTYARPNAFDKCEQLDQSEWHRVLPADASDRTCTKGQQCFRGGNGA